MFHLSLCPFIEILFYIIYLLIYLIFYYKQNLVFFVKFRPLESEWKRISQRNQIGCVAELTLEHLLTFYLNVFKSSMSYFTWRLAKKYAEGRASQKVYIGMQGERGPKTILELRAHFKGRSVKLKVSIKFEKFIKLTPTVINLHIFFSWRLQQS